MKLYFDAGKRKELVKVVEKLSGMKAKYLGAPTFAYQIGDTFTVEKDGTLSWDEHTIDNTVLATILESLKQEGFTFTEPGQLQIEIPTETPQEDPQELELTVSTAGLTISMPKDPWVPEKWENLNNLLAAKGILIQHSLDLDDLPTVIEEEDRISFPWFTVAPTDTVDVEAFTSLVDALCKMAQEQNHISPKEKPVENEKYAFRCFLLRLGMIGNDYKGVRKALLKRLSGSAAFKSGAKKEKPNEQ